ncbi:MAG TPA: hypothetical protein VIK20_07255 [Bacteroidales bacterium]
MDNLVKYAQEHNINILSGLAYNPGCYGLGGPTTICLDPVHIDKWTRYVTFMVERYDGDGYMDMPGLTKPIKHWEIWNEPNLLQFWNTGSVFIHPAAESFVDWILIPGIAAIKAADPTAEICGPGLSSSPAGDLYAWFDYIKERGVVFNVLTHHQYDGGDTASGRFADLREFHDYADNHGYSGKDFWITETGWPTNNYKGNAVQNMREMLNLMLASSSWWNKTFWFAWKSNETIPNEMYFMVDKTTNIPNDLYYTFKSYTNPPANPSSVTVEVPNGGESWACGGTYSIQYNISPDSNVKIELLKGGALDHIIINTTPGEFGYYDWTIPSTQADGSDYKIRITNYYNNTTDSSDADFSIISSGVPAPVPPSGCGTISAGYGLGVGQQFYSCDGRFLLALQSDGNLVLYQGGSTALWSSSTGNSAFGLYMQADGNLVIFSQQGVALWSSNTYGNPGSFLAIQNDGNMVIYTPQGNPIWSTNTVGK